MKYLMVLLMLNLGAWGYTQEGTTEEEYKYLSKGYAYQSDLGLDHKKDGYLIQEIYEAENKVQFIGMFHSFSGKTKAYLAVIPQSTAPAIHLCIPNNAATELIRRRFLQDKRRLLNTVALQDQFDEAWRAFFFHQSATRMNWMQPAKTNEPTPKTANPSQQTTTNIIESVEEPIHPEITSKGIPVHVRDYNVLSDALKGNNTENNKVDNLSAGEHGLTESTSETRTPTTVSQPKKQVRINGQVQGELSGRLLVKAPIVKESYLATGTIVIKICVDKTGDVIYAKFTQKGSTTFDPQLKRLALDSVHDALFEEIDLEEQCGFIAFDFR